MSAPIPTPIPIPVLTSTGCGFGVLGPFLASTVHVLYTLPTDGDTKSALASRVLKVRLCSSGGERRRGGLRGRTVESTREILGRGIGLRSGLDLRDVAAGEGEGGRVDEGDVPREVGLRGERFAAVVLRAGSAVYLSLAFRTSLLPLQTPPSEDADKALLASTDCGVCM